jgi:hypothetical protein
MMPPMGPPILRTALSRISPLLGAAALILPSTTMSASIAQSTFGIMPDGTAVGLYTLTNSNGLVCKAITYGAVITELHVPDRDGKLGDVVLGFDNLPQYIKESPCFGAVVGRVANRIAKGRFTSTARPTPSRSTIRRTRSTAGSGVSTRSSGRPRPWRRPTAPRSSSTT